MKLFKNYKSKRQLRKEIEMLQFAVTHATRPIIERYDIKKLKINLDIPGAVPLDVVKQKALHLVADSIEPCIEWDISEKITKNGIEKSLTGTIHIARRT